MAIDAGVIRWALRDVFVAAFLGFPIALVVCWFYDITRQGVVRTPPAGADPTFDKSLHRRDYLVFATLAAIWAVAIVYVHTPAPVDKSIAILPFENPGQDPDNALFAFGIRVDLQTQLQSITDLKIIARESSDRIDSDMSIAEAGLKLGAAYIMKGSVERVLDRVRINVILLDAQNEQQTWVSSYDRELNASNWFDIRNEISGVITRSLQTQLSPAERQRLGAVPTENLDALQAYFRGKQRMAKRTTETLAEAVSHFQQAVELDPEFALAWVGLADSNYLHELYTGPDDGEGYSRMKTAVDKALELDEYLGEAYATLAVFHMTADELDEAEVAFTRSLDLNPSYATAHQWFGTFLGNAGRMEEALAYKMKAQELDPLSPVISMSIGMTLHDMNRIDEALAYYENAVEVDPAFAVPYERIGDVHYNELGQLDEAAIWYRKAVALDPGQPSHPRNLGFLYLDLGDPDRTEFWFKRHKQLAPDWIVSDIILEPLYVYRGENEKALQRALESAAMNPRMPYTLANLRNFDIQAGRYDEARSRYANAFPELFETGEAAIDGGNIEAAVDLGFLLIRAGEPEKADLLLDRSLTFVVEFPREREGHDILYVLIYAMQGKTAEAFSELRRAIDHGWRRNWWYYLERDPALDSIRDEPEFQAMLGEVRADMAEQLEHIRAMDANGELEPIPDILGLISHNHRAYLPAGNGPFDTIIVIPGCSGVALESQEAEAAISELTESDLLFRAHYPRVAERLRDEGFAVYLIDILKAEGRITACGDTVPADRIATYIDEAIAWVQTLAHVNTAEIHVVGFSMGGKGTLAWLRGPRNESVAVKSVTTVYPSCSDRGPLNIAIPLLVLLGDADDIADAAVCDALIAASPTKDLIKVIHYPGARHGFDIQGAPPVMDAGNGMTVGYQEAAATSAWNELIEFLRKTR